MYKLDEHEAFQVLSCFLNRFGETDVGLLSFDILLNWDGDTGDPAAWQVWLECVSEVKAGMVPGQPLAAAPKAVVDMGARLVASGFVALEEWSDETAIGSGRADWRRDDVHIRAMRDCLQWQVWIGVPDVGWFHPLVWKAHITGSLPSRIVATDIEEKCRLTLAHLDDYESSVVDRAAAKASLSSWRAKHFKGVEVFWRDEQARGVAGPQWNP